MHRYKVIVEYLESFLDKEVKKRGFNRVTLGLSGGLDSAVVAVIANKVFKKNLLAVMMPSHYSSSSSLDDAKKLCDKFDISNETHSISEMLKVYEKTHQGMDKLRVGNLSARLRMLTLFDISARDSALVLGTSNKSELLLGYGTIYGDMASAINILGDIYKSDLFGLAKYIGVIDSIIQKPPSADLWQNQSDEEDLGYSYKDIDRILTKLVDEKLPLELIDDDKDLLNMVTSRITKNSFKRELPLIATMPI